MSMTTNPPAGDQHIYSYVAPDIVEHRFADGGETWRLGEPIRWHVLTVGGEIVGRRRTRGELLELVETIDSR